MASMRKHGLYEEACPLFLGKHVETSLLPVFPVLHDEVSLSDMGQLLTEDGLVIALLPLDLLQDGSILVEHINIVTCDLHPLALCSACPSFYDIYLVPQSSALYFFLDFC